MSQNPERDARILELWNQDHSQGQIVRALAKEGISVTRSAVAGVVHRAGQDLNKTGKSRPKVEPKPKAAPKEKYIRDGKPKPPSLPAPVELEDEPAPIGPVGEFPPDGGCQYSKGEITADFQMCGHPQRQGSKYCDWHIDNVIKKPDGRTAQGKALKARKSA